MTEKSIRCPSCCKYYPPEQMGKVKTQAGISSWRWRCNHCSIRAKFRNNEGKPQNV